MKTKKSYLLIVLIFLLITTRANAQFDKGRYLVGGQGTINSFNPKGNGESNSTVSLTFKGGAFLIKNFALGLNLNFVNVSSNSYSNLLIGPFLRYYLGDTKLFVEAEYDFGNIKGDLQTVSQNVFELELGYAAFINEHVAIEPSFYWNTYSVAGETQGTNLGINIGFQVYLGK